MNYIVLDLEFNQPFPFKTGQQTALEPECPFEIIQIGAVKLDDTFTEKETFNCIIKPQIYPRIHPYVEKITGITWDDVKNGVSFSTAFGLFQEFIGGEKSTLCTWGVDDIKSLFRNILFYSLDFYGIPQNYINIQPYASAYLNHTDGKTIGLKTAVEELEIQIEAPFHDALSDAIYTAKVFQKVRPQKLSCDTFQILDMARAKVPAPRIHITALMEHMEKKLQRPITPEERSLIKTAYKLGRKQTFDMKPEKKQSSEKGVVE